MALGGIIRGATLAWLLIGAALMMRALLPQGWMPESTQNRTLTVTMCSGGVHVIELDPDDAPDDERDAQAPCAFAGAAAQLLPSVGVSLDSSWPADSATPRGFASVGPTPASARVLPPVRGPPLPV